MCWSSPNLFISLLAFSARSFSQPCLSSFRTNRCLHTCFQVLYHSSLRMEKTHKIHGSAQVQRGLHSSVFMKKHFTYTVLCSWSHFHCNGVSGFTFLRLSDNIQNSVFVALVNCKRHFVSPILPGIYVFILRDAGKMSGSHHVVITCSSKDISDMGMTEHHCCWHGQLDANHGVPVAWPLLSLGLQMRIQRISSLVLLIPTLESRLQVTPGFWKASIFTWGSLILSPPEIYLPPGEVWVC